MHINDLLKLGVIRKSISRHHVPAFIVNNYGEQIRGKSIRVIGYHRLNDNTIDDAYDILVKTELINSIQNNKIFCKFHGKSGFWQIKMHHDSVE